MRRDADEERGGPTCREQDQALAAQKASSEEEEEERRRRRIVCRIRRIGRSQHGSSTSIRLRKGAKLHLDRLFSLRAISLSRRWRSGMHGSLQSCPCSNSRSLSLW